MKFNSVKMLPLDNIKRWPSREATFLSVVLGDTDKCSTVPLPKIYNHTGANEQVKTTADSVFLLCDLAINTVNTFLNRYVNHRYVSRCS